MFLLSHTLLPHQQRSSYSWKSCKVQTVSEEKYLGNLQINKETKAGTPEEFEAFGTYNCSKDEIAKLPAITQNFTLMSIYIRSYYLVHCGWISMKNYKR